MHLRGIAAIATCALASVLAAQDSIRPTSGLPGDAVDAHDTTEQINTFVVDTVSFTTDWGTTFSLGPISKASRTTSSMFYNSIQGSQSAGAVLLTGQQYAAPSYDLWTTPGQGVNGQENTPPAGSLNPMGTATQVAFAVNETSGEMEDVIVAIVNYDPTDPSRLYVKRVNSAITGPDEFTSNSNFGLGQVDASGNVHFRADDFSLTGGNPVVANNLFRVDANARTAGILNEINGSGAADTGVQLLAASFTTHNVPGAMPTNIAGRPVLAGSNFNSQYVYESAAGVLSATTAHLGAAGDHRGGMHFSKAIAIPGSAGTLALIGKDPAGATTDRIIVFGVDVNGNVFGTPLNLILPTAVTDNWDGFNWPPPAVGSGTAGEPIHHGSQTAFAGGNGQVAVGQDPVTGEILVATTTVVADAALVNPNENPANAIVVARFDPANPTGTLQWTLAAYNDRSGVGKAYTDGVGGTIGHLVELNVVTGGIPNGPSMSSPAIDSAGNVWFQSAASTDLGGGMTDDDTVLLRAVYDSATFSYQLEKVLEPGDRFTGKNSGTEYMVTFMGIADSNSISSGAMFSGNVVQCACNDIDASLLPSSDPRTLGGLAVNVEITYDVNGDGLFEGGTTTPDQEYNVLMYLGPDTCPPPAPPVFTYCTAKPSDALGCVGSIGTVGPIPPVSGANDFSVTVSGIDGLKPGIFFAANTAQATIPFLGGTLCFLPPLNRGSINFSFGTGGACDGAYSQIINDGLFFPPSSPKGFDGGPGGTTFMQAWYRSPCGGCASGFDIGLSNAVELNWAP